MRIAITLCLSLSHILAGPPQAQSIHNSYQSVADKIIAAALADSASFDRLAELVDTFGPRFSGSSNLEDAITWVLHQMVADSLENAHTEPVMIPHWVRGKESAEMLVPRRKKLEILGLGRSVGTSFLGLKAEVLVVGSFDELQARAAEAVGKIVLYNVPFTNYRETVKYRGEGAIEASKVGAVGMLVRSVTPHSLNTPHTGAMKVYQEGVAPIPGAAVTVEDALLMQRLADRGETIVVRLKMGAKTLPDVISRNVMAEIIGSEFPDEIVVMGGHIDSWDVGQGAMDDAGGSIAAWEALRLLNDLGLKPRRTIRVVLWTNEENGLAGGKAYKAAHENETERHILAIESDGGVFKPTGFGFVGSAGALAIVQEIGKLLKPIEADKVAVGRGGADITPLTDAGVPGLGLNVDASKYFWYHHTHADTIDKLDPHELNLCIAAMAVMAYVVADLPDKLPR